MDTNPDKFQSHDDVIKLKHFPCYWPFVRGIHRSPVNSPHKGQWRGALMFSLICVWINGWVNNREAGDLRRYGAHYDVIVMIILNRGGDVSISLPVQDNVVIPFDHIRMPGITLNDSLNFDLHISDKCKKASRQINALKRISKFLTQDSRKSKYRSFIAANFNYCPISLMFCGKKYISAREVPGARPSSRILWSKFILWRSLKGGQHLFSKAYHIKCLAVEVFKWVHEFNPTYLIRLFTEPLANYNFRDRRRLNQPKFHTFSYGFISFRYSGSKFWNSLPRAIKNTNDINEFKKNTTEWCQTWDLSELEIIQICISICYSKCEMYKIIDIFLCLFTAMF